MSKKRGARTEKLLRNNVTTLRFNHKEKEAIDLYCKKYKISNKAKFMRETIITEVLRRFDEDYPRLF